MRHKTLPALFLMVLLAAMLILSGCQQGGETAKNDPPPSTRTVTLYFSDEQAMYLVGESRQITLSPSAQAASDQAGEMVRELIAGPREPGHVRTIPAETRLLGVTVADGIATVDFSEELRSKHPGGSSGELMTVYSLVDSLTGMAEIKQVQIHINGLPLDTLAGHLDLTRPLVRDESMIKR